MNLILNKAISDPIWLNHKIGQEYKMDGVGGWKIAYYPLFGTYKGEEDNKRWVEFNEPRALVEKPIVIDGKEGIDFREVPLRYLKHG